MKLIDISTPSHPKTFAVVDDQDFERLNSHKWYLGRNGYVARNRPKPLRGCIYMHRDILGDPPGTVDHINHDPLDNQRSNLRLTDKRGNAANMRTKARCGLKGVTAHPDGRWRARIKVDGKQICLGLHSSPEKAHEAYMKAAEIHFGPYAYDGGKVTPTR